LTVRLVAFDVDGTLTRSDGTVSAATTAALQALSVPYVLVTGRPRRWVDGLAASLGSSGAAIVVNGALTYDLGTGATIAARSVAPEVAAACAASVRAVLPDARFAAEWAEGFGSEPDYPRRFPDPSALRAPLADLLSRPVLKLLCRSGSHDSADALYDVVVAACAGHPLTFTHSTGTVGLLEIAAAGVDKAAALEAYAASLGIDAADVLAVGDGFNDVPMLRWAGRGVAMANAHPAAIEAADEVIASNDDDGVATLLASL
jgi:hydroxymethylpyrimidine pyrophosphatase-like HAD family hydrolase